MRNNKRCQICYGYIKKSKVYDTTFYCETCNTFHSVKERLLVMPKDLDELVFKINEIEGEFIKPIKCDVKFKPFGFILTGTFSFILTGVNRREAMLVLQNIYSTITKNGKVN